METSSENRAGLPEQATRGRESFALKLWGLILMGVSIPLWGYLANQVESNLWLLLVQEYNTGLWHLGSYVLLSIAAANVLSLGVLLALSGMSKLSLNNSRTRRGLWTKLAGANCLALSFAAAGLMDSDPPESLTPLFGGLCIGFGWLGIGTLRKGWKHDAVAAKELLASDSRPPVVYIRSFRDDDTLAVSGWRKWLLLWVPTSFEQDLASIMKRLGPFVAVGKPGEPLPELGAARFYFDDSQWRGGVSDLMKQSRLVVIRSGTTANLWWEIEHATTVLSPRQLVLISVGQDKQSREFEQQLEQRLHLPKSIQSLDRTPVSALQRLMLLGRGPHVLGKVISFDEDWRCHVEPIRNVYRLKAILHLYTPFAVPLESTFEKVFQRLGVSLKPAGPSRSTAVALAVFAGIFGAHKFYLGEKRKGLYYLLFFWSFVPFVLGWIDAVRLLLMKQSEFERRYGNKEPE